MDVVYVDFLLSQKEEINKKDSRIVSAFDVNILMDVPNFHFPLVFCEISNLIMVDNYD